MGNTFRVCLLIQFCLSITIASGDEKTIVAIDDEDKTQYHEVNLNTSGYNYGYEVGPNRQFHHEIRGGDGVTYGCYGYVNPDEKLLVTHYVADRNGYRLIQSNKPVKIYPLLSDPMPNALDDGRTSVESKGRYTEWKDLFLPRGCRVLDIEANANNFNGRPSEKGGSSLPGLPRPGIGLHPLKPLLPAGQINAGISAQVATGTGSASLNAGGALNSQSQQGPGGAGFGLGGQISSGNNQGSFQISGGVSGPQNVGANYHNNTSSSSASSSSSSSQSNSQSSSSFESGYGYPSNVGSNGSGVSIQHGSSISGSGPLGQVSGGHQSGASWSHQQGGNIHHGGSLSASGPLGQVTGGHQTGASFGNNQNSNQGGNIHHGSSFTGTSQLGQVSAGHQSGVSWENNQNQGSSSSHGNNQNQGGYPGQGSNQIQGYPGQGNNFNYGGQSNQGNNQNPNQGNNGGYPNQGSNQNQGNNGSNQQHGSSSQNGGSFNNYGQASGGQASTGSWNNGQQQNHGQNYNGYNNGQYQPDNSGNYVHVPGSNGPGSYPYEHVQGPSGGFGGQGSGGGNGFNGGVGGNGGIGGNGLNGPPGPNGPYGQPGPDNQGGYGSQGAGESQGLGGSQGTGGTPVHEVGQPDVNCTEPSHQHSTSRPTHTKPTFTTRRTTIYTPPSTTQRPSTTTKHPHTHKTNPTTAHTYQTNRPNTPTTQRPTQTYPTRPASTPNPTGSSGSNLGVQPPSTYPTTPNPNVFVPGSQPPFFIIPYPFQFAPTCPCYAVEPAGNQSSQQQQQLQVQQQSQTQSGNQNAQLQWQSQNQYGQYAIGFIPVLFVPHCFNGNVSGQYLQVPYPCSQCNQSNRNGRELDLNEDYSSSDSFKQVLAQAGVDIFSNSLVKSPHRKRARKLKRIQSGEEPHMNELHKIEQSSPKDEK